jgi:hypothetical protein
VKKGTIDTENKSVKDKAAMIPPKAVLELFFIVTPT